MTPPQIPTRVSLIIPTRDNLPYLTNALESALQNGLGPADEIIVVANGRHEETAPTLAYVRSLDGIVPTRVRGIREETPGYIAAMNTGLAAAKGAFLLFGNDDVVFAPRWLDALLAGFQAGDSRARAAGGRLGFIGPTTNNAIPAQMVNKATLPESDHLGALLPVAARVLESGNVFYPLAFVSGFCLLVTRECFDAVGLLDAPTFAGTTGGYSDNDWCLRAVRAGFTGGVAGKAFVYHHGNVSMDAYFPGHRAGIENNALFMRKWQRDPDWARKQTLIVNYRVQLRSDDDVRFFTESVRAVRALGAEIVVVDDRSPHPVETVLEQAGLTDVCLGIHRNPDDAGYNEIRDRTKALELARAFEPDWIMNLDHDEVIDKVTPETLQELLHPADPAVLGYRIPFYTFWRGETDVRVDFPWGEMRPNILFRNLPGTGAPAPGIPESDGVMHCTRFPNLLALDSFRTTYKLVVRHLGYVDPVRCAEKQAWYRAHDTEMNAALIGIENYNHLTDERSLRLYPYRTVRTALAMMTGRERTHVVRHVLLWHHFVDEIVLLDTSGQDMFADLADVARVVPWQCCDRVSEPDHLFCSFAEARNALLDAVTADYVIEFDPDETVKVQPPFVEWDVALPTVLLEDATAFGIAIDNHYLTPEGRRTAVTTRCRVHKNLPAWRYVGRAHETIPMLDTPGLITQPMATLGVTHLGGLQTPPDLLAKKHDRYRELLAQDADEDPTNDRALFYLGADLAQAPRTMDTGLACMQAALRLVPDDPQYRWDYALHLLRKATNILLAGDAGAVYRKTPQLLQGIERLLTAISPFTTPIDTVSSVLDADPGPRGSHAGGADGPARDGSSADAAPWGNGESGERHPADGARAPGS